jgi:hypothetical protein
MAGVSEFFPMVIKARDMSWKQSSRTVSTKIQLILVSPCYHMPRISKHTSILLFTLVCPDVVDRMYLNNSLFIELYDIFRLEKACLVLLQELEAVAYA